MRYTEKLIILLVLFVGVCITTAGIIGSYVGIKNRNNANSNKNNNTITIETINLY